MLLGQEKLLEFERFHPSKNRLLAQQFTRGLHHPMKLNHTGDDGKAFEVALQER